MRDQFGRTITYLRVSVIDKCNLRCFYCLPKNLLSRKRMDELLTDRELVSLIGIFADLGIRKVRLTGGEPLLRPGLADLIREIKGNPLIHEVAMSTNGLLLRRSAQALKEAGLRRINVSLDTLSRERFARITGFDGWSEVVAGILEAQAAGLGPVKLNAVLMRGVNDEEVVPLVDFALAHGLELRFIEWMPTNALIDAGREDLFLSNTVAREKIERFYTLVPDDEDPHAPARRFRIEGTSTRVGFINPLSNAFCDQCNRVRLKANGRIKTCLHGPEELDLKEMLRTNRSPEEIRSVIRRAVFWRPEEHFLNRPEVAHRDFVMTQVGG